eukprot:15479680-Alexandrium_andersonii.AAC.1
MCIRDSLCSSPPDTPYLDHPSARPYEVFSSPVSHSQPYPDVPPGVRLVRACALRLEMQHAFPELQMLAQALTPFDPAICCLSVCSSPQPGHERACMADHPWPHWTVSCHPLLIPRFKRIPQPPSMP